MIDKRVLQLVIEKNSVSTSFNSFRYNGEPRVVDLGLSPFIHSCCIAHRVDADCSLLPLMKGTQTYFWLDNTYLDVLILELVGCSSREEVPKIILAIFSLWEAIRVKFAYVIISLSPHT